MSIQTTHDSITAAGELFKSETGFEPQRLRAARNAGPQGRANALLADLDWYYKHTQDIHRRLRREINAAIA